MKKILFILISAIVLFESGCASVFGEHGLTADQRDCQHHKPGIGEPKRKVRPAAIICDIVFGFIYGAPVTLGIDFLTGDIYKPCKVDIKYQTTVQKDTLPTQMLNGMVYEDNNVQILFHVESTSINFKATNKTKQSMKIDWNDVSIVQNGTTCRAVHNGVKLKDRNESQPPSTIPAGAILDDGVTPSDNIYWDKPVSSLSVEGGYYGSWMATPLIISPEIRLYLPIQYQNKTIEYNITFKKLINVTKP